MKKILIVAAAVLGVAVIAGGAWWLFAGDEGESTARGTCGGVTYELSAETDDGVLEATFELQSAGPAEAWQVELTGDGEDLFDGERTTDEDGELDVDVVVQDEDTSSFEATATPANGEACTATLER